MDLGLKDKVALVTAASRGLGRATVDALAAEGVQVVAVARDAARLAELENRYPGRCAALAGDLRDPDLPRRAVEFTIDRFGAIDILVSNTAGPASVMPFDASVSDFAAAFETTCYPAVRLIQAAAAPMCAQGFGRILIVSSTSVKAPKPFLCLSAASRSALWAWAKSAAPQLMESGVTINALFAGPHETDRARELRISNVVLGSPEDFGTFAASLCGTHTRFITGTGYILDGGELKGI